MHDRAQKVFEFLKSEIICSNNLQSYLTVNPESNIHQFDNETKELDRTVYFTRHFVDTLFEQPKLSEWTAGTGVENNLQIVNLSKYVLKAILTDTYKVGHCEEVASLGLLHLLQSGINKNVEIVSMRGSATANSLVMDHVCLIIDRDLKSNVENPSEWKSIIKLDAWGESGIISYNENQSPTKDSLGAGAVDFIRKIEIDFCWDRNLTEHDCSQIIVLLKKIKNEFTEDLILSASENSGRGPMDLRKERDRILQKIDYEITNFEILKKSLTQVSTTQKESGQNQNPSLSTTAPEKFIEDDKTIQPTATSMLPDLSSAWKDKPDEHLTDTSTVHVFESLNVNAKNAMLSVVDDKNSASADKQSDELNIEKMYLIMNISILQTKIKEGTSEDRILRATLQYLDNPNTVENFKETLCQNGYQNASVDVKQLVSEAFELTGQSEILKEFERPQVTNEDGSIVHIKFKSS